MKITIELLEENYLVNIQDIYELKTIREISDNFYYPKKSNVYKGPFLIIFFTTLKKIFHQKNYL